MNDHRVAGAVNEELLARHVVLGQRQILTLAPLLARRGDLAVAADQLALGAAFGLEMLQRHALLATQPLLRSFNVWPSESLRPSLRIQLRVEFGVARHGARPEASADPPAEPVRATAGSVALRISPNIHATRSDPMRANARTSIRAQSSTDGSRGDAKYPNDL